jgi:hypothetical protein
MRKFIFFAKSQFCQKYDNFVLRENKIITKIQHFMIIWFTYVTLFHFKNGNCSNGNKCHHKQATTPFCIHASRIMTIRTVFRKYSIRNVSWV